MGDVIDLGLKPSAVSTSDFINKLNDADLCARLYTSGQAAGVVVIETLVGLGFYDVRIAERRVRASFNGVRFTLGE